MPPSQKEALQKQIAAHTRRLQLLKERQAQQGIETPPSVITEIEDIEAKLIELQAELEALPQIIRQNPYRGLSAFREQDADVFFGRETFTAQLVESVQQKPLVAVLGPSGSGKSSIVFAGLSHALRHCENQWLIRSFRPGSDPFQALAAVLLPLYEIDLDKTDQMIKIPKLATYLREGDLPLKEVVRNIFEVQSQATQFLLIADQFEELYTLTQDTEIRHRFLDLLLAAIDTNASATSTDLQLLLTLRADFLGQALLNPPLSDVLQDNIKLLGPMSLDELRMTIEEPTDRRGASLEPGLVERILDDVKNEPGNLPLLEFALTTLWEQQQQGQLTHAAYKTIGRVEGALSGHADKVFDGLSETDQEQARRLFLRLVQPGEGAEDTRRLVTKAELGETIWSLVQRLADERLLVTDRDPDEREMVEVAHEALITGWERLRNWIEADRSFLTWQKRLRFALEQWQASEQDEGALLRGSLLAEAEAWLGRREGDLGQTERDFIQASIALREKKQQQEKDYRKLRLVSGILSQGAKGWNLSGADLSGADLSGADLNGANLSGVDLNGADLNGADLSGADLSGADLSGADLRGAKLNWAKLSEANLDDTTQIDDKWRLVWEVVSQRAVGRDLRRGDLSRADLDGADLNGAKLSEADLREVKLRGGDLSGADLNGAKLSGADLREANLSGANLRKTTFLFWGGLNGAKLSEARYTEATKWPRGFTPPPDAILVD